MLDKFISKIESALEEREEPTLCRENASALSSESSDSPADPFGDLEMSSDGLEMSSEGLEMSDDGAEMSDDGLGDSGEGDGEGDGGDD